MYLDGKVILVIGGTGSFGKKFDEMKQYEMKKFLARRNIKVLDIL